MKNNCGIYLILCNENGKRYIGSSKDIAYRTRKHFEQMRYGRHKNAYMQRSWNKHGADSFQFFVLEVVEDEKQLKEKEQYWIDAIKPEFNMTPYAERPTTEGLERTPAWLQGMSEGIKRYWANMSEEERKERGRKATHPHTEETKRFLAENTRKAFEDGRLSRIRRPRTDEEKAKILSGMAGHLKEVRIAKAERRAEWEKGREAREAARRAKISAAKKGVPLSEETKAKLREAATAQMADPEMQVKHRQAVKEAMQRPEVKEALAKRPKPVRTAEANAKSAAKHRGRKNSPETIELMKQKRREWWARKKAEQAAQNDNEADNNNLLTN